MKKNFTLILAIFLAFAFPASAYALHSREDIRAAYQKIDNWYEGSPYAAQPNVEAPYAPGEIAQQSLTDAQNYLNFLRWLAYLDAPVELSRIYNYQCQHGAVLLAALNYLDHNAPRPDDMDENFYDSAHLATSSGNIAKFNWMRPGILREGIAYFARDDGEANLPVLGHRRWLLNPYMSDTGFGLANSAEGMSYVVMFAHDFGRPSAEWQRICWPSEGAFPADLMHADLAWSVILNPEAYDLAASRITVELTEETLGLRFHFDVANGTGDGYCALNTDGYGAGPCLIFRPDFQSADFTDYQQNQRWTVAVNGLKTVDGAQAELRYTVDMISLYAQEAVNVELSTLEAALSVGETLTLRADVIPAYADDLTVSWSSTDARIATVSPSGVVTALAAGECEITARTANGRADQCHLQIQ